MNLPSEARAAETEFDRFGLFNMQDNNGKDCAVYHNELTYTAGGAMTSWPRVEPGRAEGGRYDAIISIANDRVIAPSFVLGR